LRRGGGKIEKPTFQFENLLNSRIIFLFCRIPFQKEIEKETDPNFHVCFKLRRRCNEKERENKRMSERVAKMGERTRRR
jgi:hypothetical protein